MKVFSYVAARIEDITRKFPTGVPRFDMTLRRAIKGLESVVKLPALDADDIVIADNHLSLDVPPHIKTVVVHHGCALTHYERDPMWQYPHTFEICEKQRRMFDLPNRVCVSQSYWAATEFAKRVPNYPKSVSIIQNWVERIEPLPKSGKPIIIGDWRDNNKGINVWRKLAEKCDKYEFQPLAFTDDAGRRKQYGEASLYLCLSLSEGGAHAVCDAEAAELPIVTTDVGNYISFTDCEVIRWQDRDNVDLVLEAIERKMKAGRRNPSYYKSYTFDKYRGLWNLLLKSLSTLLYFTPMGLLDAI